MDHYRKQAQPRPVPEFAHMFSDLTVANGPFRGMRYPSLDSTGSELYPKLVGSYEAELHAVVEKFLEQASYELIVDIGCAEGFYAVGLARRCPGIPVHAFDINDRAQIMCREMALLNGVGDQVSAGAFCTAELLKNLVSGRKSLIICDCEGYEDKLFTPDNLSGLLNSDLIIELHDFVDVNISPKLLNLFESTHEIQVIKSIDDIEKMRTYTFLNGSYSLYEKKRLYEERRPGIMEWMVCRPRSDKG